MSTRVTVHMIQLWKCGCAYIVQNLLEDTSTASALILLICICVGAESVLQNCVMGDVLICILLQFDEPVRRPENLMLKYFLGKMTLCYV